MKRFLLCTVIAASISGSAFAQDIAVKPFEFEIGAGMTIGNKYGMDKVVPGHNAFMEARVNLFETSWDLGVQASFGATAKNQEETKLHGFEYWVFIWWRQEEISTTIYTVKDNAGQRLVCPALSY